MAKRYGINSISGTEFTYQLYANLNPQVNGETTVACDAESVSAASWLDRSQTFDGYYTFGSNIYAWENNSGSGEVDIYSTANLGVSWSLETSLTGAFWDNGTQVRFVQSGATLYIFIDAAVGSLFYRSTADGVTWSAEIATALPDDYLEGLVYFGTTWYSARQAQGEIYSLSGSPVALWNPTITTVHSFNTTNGNAEIPLVYNGVFYYLNTNAANRFYMSSPDGTTWTNTVTDAIDGWPQSITYRNVGIYDSKVVYLVPNATRIDSTTDFTSWTTLISNIDNSPLPQQQFLRVAGTDIYAFRQTLDLHYLEQN
jgi:hypothetical protein